MTAPYPPLDDLLLTVREFLDALRPELVGERRYQAQVAAYLLTVALRERGAAAPETVPPLDGAADVAAFREALRAGRYDDRAEIAEALLANAVRDAAMVRPDHLAPEHREVRP